MFFFIYFHYLFISINFPDIKQVCVTVCVTVCETVCVRLCVCVRLSSRASSGVGDWLVCDRKSSENVMWILTLSIDSLMSCVDS